VSFLFHFHSNRRRFSFIDTEKGYKVDFVAASDDTGAKKFREYGEFNYDNLILFAPAAEGKRYSVEMNERFLASPIRTPTHRVFLFR
jgi:hypothetical protein